MSGQSIAGGSQFANSQLWIVGLQLTINDSGLLISREFHRFHVVDDDLSSLVAVPRVRRLHRDGKPRLFAVFEFSGTDDTQVGVGSKSTDQFQESDPLFDFPCLVSTPQDTCRSLPDVNLSRIPLYRHGRLNRLSGMDQSQLVGEFIHCVKAFFQ